MDDSRFLETYSKASRLSFIGRWEDIWSELLDARDDQDGEVGGPDAPDAGRERVIFHVDLDCFFASVIVRDRPELKGRPVAVAWSGGKESRSEISSCTYEARARGVRAGMWLKEAMDLCPGLVSVPYDFDAFATAAAAAHSCVLDVTRHVVRESGPPHEERVSL